MIYAGVQLGEEMIGRDGGGQVRMEANRRQRRLMMGESAFFWVGGGGDPRVDLNRRIIVVNENSGWQALGAFKCQIFHFSPPTVNQNF